MNDNNFEPEFFKKPFLSRIFTLETLLLIMIIAAGAMIVWQIVNGVSSPIVLMLSGVVFTLSAIAVLRLLMDPDSIRARQTDAMLLLARHTTECMKNGLDTESAQRVCELLLPSTAAVAVAITDKKNVLGYAGVSERSEDLQGLPIATRSTVLSIEDGRTRIITTPYEIGFPEPPKVIKAAIIVPLRRGRLVVGTLKFYFRSPRNISETQKSIAEGFGQLLSTQISAEALEEQTKLATSMELKALQAQINPHFLFNTINTIASLIRTDPTKARSLLREFAVFYRHTLENAEDLIPMSRELEQTVRYFDFERARFGDERLRMTIDVPDDVRETLMPSFLIQPLVENAVRHGRRPEGTLNITISAWMEDNVVTVSVKDDGRGMTEEQRLGILSHKSSTGLGIAVRNVHDRIEGYFGPGSHMEFESELGKGTTVLLIMNNDSPLLAGRASATEGVPSVAPDAAASRAAEAGAQGDGESNANSQDAATAPGEAQPGDASEVGVHAVEDSLSNLGVDLPSLVNELELSRGK